MKVLVSACLLGEKCKWNGRDNFSEAVENLKNKVEFVPVCSEVISGMPTPRIPSEIIGDKVFNQINLDVSKYFEYGRNQILKIALENNIKYAIFKDGSPSDGVHKIYDGTFSRNKIAGKGRVTSLLEEHHIKVYSEDEVDLFIQEVLDRK
ncbi:MAG: DUF523 domain-containing protein [Bacilli bacterium]